MTTSLFNELTAAGAKLRTPRSLGSLVDIALEQGGAKLTRSGQIAAYTTPHTFRNPRGKQLVFDQLTDHSVDWQSEFNRHPLEPVSFNRIKERMLEYARGRSIITQKLSIGGDPGYQQPVRVMTELAWQALFANRLFIRNGIAWKSQVDPWEVLVLPGFKAVPDTDGNQDEAFVIINFSEKCVLIGGTLYAGEIKKAMFTVLNFVLTELGMLSLHCSANIGSDNHISLFLGLSGTGKTTHSNQLGRRLIGDDEHGWTPDGIRNHEGGCYAICKHFDPVQEPGIAVALTRKYSVFENVVLKDGEPDWYDTSITDNTRAAFALHDIPHVYRGKLPGHPKTIFMLAADGFGVMPGIAVQRRRVHLPNQC